MPTRFARVEVNGTKYFVSIPDEVKIIIVQYQGADRTTHSCLFDEYEKFQYTSCKQNEVHAIIFQEIDIIECKHGYAPFLEALQQAKMELAGGDCMDVGE